MHHATDVSNGGIRRAALLKALLAITLIALGFAALASRAQAAPVISYPSFSGATGLQLNGAASLASSSLRLTSAETNTSGTAFSRTEIQPSGSFETEFELRMHESSTLTTFGLPADGIAFVLQPASVEEVGQSGGDLGYAGISPSAVVQFDIYQNPYDSAGVPDISFMENGNAETHLAESEKLPFELYSETPVLGWINYNASTQELSVYAAPAPSSKPAKALFTYKVNLAALLQSEYTFAGFTAGTGSGDAVQEVLNWQFSSALPTHSVEGTPPTKTPTATTHGSATSVTCNLIIATASDTCIATVADVDVPAAITPTGTVSFSSASGGVFSAGNTCNLVATNPDIASCSVQFLPPTAASTLPSITATYGGDTRHSGSSGHTYYGGAVALGPDVTISGNGAISENGNTVTVPVSCQFPCSITGELMSGPEGSAITASLSGDNTAVIAKAKKKPHKKKKKIAKSVLLGKGSLTLSKPGSGVLVIKLSGKAKLAIKKAKGKAIKGVLEITVSTVNGTLVKTEKKTITIRPAKKKPKKKSKHGKHH
jgi:Legume lectin domain